MDNSTITCPKCHASFALTTAVEQQIVDGLRLQLESDYAKKLAALQSEDQKRKAQLEERESQLRTQTEVLRREKADADAQVAARVEEAKQALQADAATAAHAEVAMKMQELNDRLQSKDAALTLARAAELDLRKQRDEFEDQKKNFELEVARRADAARDEMAKRKDEEHRQKEALNAQKLAEMTKQIVELKQRAEQGSQQTQGEALEADLECALKRAFPFDDFLPVPTGVTGADLIQQVNDERGQPCGSIIWESKQTKAWSDGWITKLKDDKLRAKAQIAIIVSASLPKAMNSFECREGVWVVGPALAMALAAALRPAIVDTAAVRRSVEGRDDKMAAVYQYLAGTEFKDRVTAIVESFRTMKEDLDGEKRSMTRLWAKREKQLDRIMLNTAGLHGDLHGIIGQTLPVIDLLELDSGKQLPGQGLDPIASSGEDQAHE